MIDSTLVQELDGHLHDFASMSEHKLSKASEKAVEMYEDRMLSDVMECQLCAEPAALEAKHRAVAAAVADAFRHQLQADSDDKETKRLLKVISLIAKTRNHHRRPFFQISISVTP